MRKPALAVLTAAVIGAVAMAIPGASEAGGDRSSSSIAFARAYAGINPRDDAPQAFGCQRIWRCSKEGCGWRRACWGIYGYRESPYYYGLARRHEGMHWEGAISARVSRRALRDLYPPLDPRYR